MNEEPSLTGPAKPYRPCELEIVTERLRLAPVGSNDVADLARLWTDERVRRHLGGVLDTATALERASSYTAKLNSFAIHKRRGNQLIGLVTLGGYRTGDLEVSYQLFPESCGRGYAREAVAATVAWGFVHVQPGRIIAVTQTANVASTRLLRAIGMNAVDEFEEFGEQQTMYSIDAPNALTTRS